MGMDQTVTFSQAPPTWATVSDLLTRRGFLVQTRMIDGQLAFPDEVPPDAWKELRLGTPIEDALLAAYGPIEVYGFHALEALQAMIERREGGEVGVRASPAPGKPRTVTFSTCSSWADTSLMPLLGPAAVHGASLWISRLRSVTSPAPRVMTRSPLLTRDRSAGASAWSSCRPNSTRSMPAFIR